VFKIECDICKKQEDGHFAGKYWVPPDSWSVSKSNPPLAVCKECVPVRLEKFKGIPLTFISRKMRELVGPENCKWCKAIGRVCPAHRKKENAS